MNFWTLLTILFIGLKLANIIDWSWFWVLSPILMPILFLSFIWVVAIIAAMILDR
jgi:hypothetical protein